ncbi:MAG: MgtC/SapB family protein [Chlorobi bacterium]|nr:MgtC/SapB family protein [Chlorobiota bacterium]
MGVEFASGHSVVAMVQLISQEALTSNLTVVLQKAGIALLIGVLVGLERERDRAKGEELFAGIRTFPLIALLGFLSSLLASATSYWVLAVALTAFFGLVITTYAFSAREGHIGMTTEVSALIVFILGALVFLEFYTIAIASAVILTLVLTVKTPLHRLVEKIQEEDIYATLKFAVITAIILPVLPDQTFGPFDVLNPRQIWYMVVLIAGVSFLGYILVKVFGSSKGITLTGMLGGLVSSTAVTLSFSQKSKEAPDLGRTFSSAIILACTIMYPRVLIMIAVVNRDLLVLIWPSILILTLTGLGASMWLWRKASRRNTEGVEIKNPFELRSAIKFGLIFAVILFVSKASEFYFGDSGVYITAGLAGLTDVDAITLSMANLAKTTLSETTAVSAILLAMVSNTIVKAGIAIVLGAVSLRKYTFPSFSILALVGLVLVFYNWFQPLF